MPGKRKSRDSSYDPDTAAAEEIEEYVQEKKTKKAKKAKVQPGSDNPGGSSKGSTSKGTGTKRRGNTGKLERMNYIQTDIFLEIAEHLNPLDVFNLARTTKAWRATLMSKDSRPVWRAALSSLPFIPPCPEDMSEPAYIRLFFLTDCYKCGSRNVPGTYFCWRTRLCAFCRENSGIVKEWERKKKKRAYNDPDLLSIVPHHIDSQYGTRYDSLPLMDEWMRTIAQKKSQLLPQAYQTWASEQKAKVEQLLQDAKEFTNAQGEWEVYKYESKQPKAAAREDKSQRRKEAIKAKLKALGYSDWDINAVVTGYSSVRNIISYARPLTEAEFERIRPAIEAEIVKLRVAEHDRLKKRGESLRKNELMRVYDDFYSSSDTRAAGQLTPADFMELPCIVRIWSNWNVRVTPELWPSRHDLQEDVQAKLLDIRSQLGRELRRHLETHRPEVVDAPVPAVAGAAASALVQSSSDMLPDVSTYVFSCHYCNTPLAWPSLLQHECVSRRDLDQYWRSDNVLNFRIENSLRFETKLVNVSEDYLRILERLKEAAHAAGHSASSVADLDRLDFCCLVCNSDETSGKNWLEFVSHVRNSMRYGPSETEHSADEMGQITERTVVDS